MPTISTTPLSSPAALHSCLLRALVSLCSVLPLLFVATQLLVKVLLQLGVPNCEVMVLTLAVSPGPRVMIGCGQVSDGTKPNDETLVCVWIGGHCGQARAGPTYQRQVESNG